MFCSLSKRLFAALYNGSIWNVDLKLKSLASLPYICKVKSLPQAIQSYDYLTKYLRNERHATLFNNLKL